MLENSREKTLNNVDKLIDAKNRVSFLADLCAAWDNNIVPLSNHREALMSIMSDVEKDLSCEVKI